MKALFDLYEGRIDLSGRLIPASIPLFTSAKGYRVSEFLNTIRYLKRTNSVDKIDTFDKILNNGWNGIRSIVSWTSCE